MEVTLQYFDSCPNWQVAEQRIKEAVKEHGLDVSLSYQLIASPEDADRFGFHGSPSILIDGQDPFATEDTPVAFACRIYPTEHGPEPSPTVEQIAASLGQGR